jgi:hypothetical protein
MSLIPTLPITITPRRNVHWAERLPVGRLINESLWLDIDCQFLTETNAERAALAAMTLFTAPTWLEYQLPTGYQIRLLNEPEYRFITTVKSVASVKFEARFITDPYSASVHSSAPPRWFLCSIPTSYTAVQQPRRTTQRFLSQRTRVLERASGNLFHVNLSVRGLTRGQFFEFLGWWSKGLSYGLTAFSFAIPGVGESARIVGWKTVKRGLFDLELNLRMT